MTQSSNFISQSEIKSLELLAELRAFRKNAGLTQYELSEKSMVSLNTIKRMENAQHFPKIDTLIRVAIALGYDLHLTIDHSAE